MGKEAAKKKRRPTQFSLTKAALIFAMTILVFLGVNLTRQAVANYYRSDDARLLQRTLEASREQEALLERELEYVKTDAYVEKTVRELWKYNRPGETLIIVLPTPKPTPTPLPRPTVVPTPQASGDGSWLSSAASWLETSLSDVGSWLGGE